ncbi:MAG: hypothetical protein E8D47_04990 [Nitrospira sp.]|nr:MAG: hypothetical protein E8D47_04990 [Nitrospira sp.]
MGARNKPKRHSFQTIRSFASEAQRADVIERIGAGGSTYSSSQSMPFQPGDSHVAGMERGMVAVIERIGAGGSTYSSSQPMPFQPGDSHVAGMEWGKVDVIERIGAGGSTYSSSQPMLVPVGEGATYSYNQSTSH